jgi:hypothetical protein
MVAVEQSVAAQATSIADHEAQLRQLVIGLTKSAETAARNTESCQALSVTTERLLKQQDVMNNKLDAVDSHVHNIDKRLASLEETIHTALEHSSGPSGHREEHVIQGIATKHTLENGAFPYTKSNYDTAPSRDRSPRCARNNREPYQQEFRMPKTNFPKFDGTHPKMWKEQAEKYFNY